MLTWPSAGAYATPVWRPPARQRPGSPDVHRIGVLAAWRWEALGGRAVSEADMPQRTFVLDQGMRGSANWPFIITLLLFLAFGYMWYDEKGKREKAEEAQAAAQVKEGVSREAARDLFDN